MDDALLVRVLHRIADRRKQREALGRGELVFVAVARDRHAAHQLHHEIRPPARGDAGIEDPRDMRVLHERERLPLGLEARDDRLRVHAQLDHLERDHAAQRLLLLRHPHHAHAAFAEALDELVVSEPVAGLLLG